MAPRRLTDSEKKELVVRYREGEATARLAAAYGCSPNTVSRTVKSLLSAEDYAALKVSRQKGVMAPLPAPSTTLSELGSLSESGKDQPAPSLSDSDSGTDSVESADGVGSLESPADTAPTDQPVGTGTTNQSVGRDASVTVDDGTTLALDDADDFGDDSDEEPEDEDSPMPETEAFQELIPLVDVGNLSDRQQSEPLPLDSGVLPSSVYMLVDKVVELDVKPLSDFPELGLLDEAERERQGLCLFTSPRSAKRQCGRSQRVIKVPDTGVFERTSSYLLARGITRLVMEGTLIAIDTHD